MKTIIFFTVLNPLLLFLAEMCNAQTVTVYSIPSDAAVIVNDIEVGNTPYRLEGQTGQKAVVQVQKNALTTVLINHVFEENQAVFVDLNEGRVIDESSFWRQRSAKIPETVTDTVFDSDDTEQTVDVETDEPDVDQPMVFYSDKDVDQQATVLKQPPIGSIPVDIIQLDMQGSAMFSVFIDSEGQVVKAETVESTGDDSLDRYVIQMIKGSFWAPARKDGIPVGYTRNLTLEYNTAAVRFRFTDIERL
jgi:TonB family protein